MKIKVVFNKLTNRIAWINEIEKGHITYDHRYHLFWMEQKGLQVYLPQKLTKIFKIKK
jgi:hypothetical protein